MITCIAIDDEPKALEVLKRYCEKTSLVSLKETFREPVKAIEFLQREKVDLIFLDISMPISAACNWYKLCRQGP